VGPVGPTDKENQVKVLKSTVLGIGTVHYLCETARIRTRIKRPDPDPYQVVKQDPDPCQIEKPDPDQKGLDPQHWTKVTVI
jgi:hypothetical protein